MNINTIKQHFSTSVQSDSDSDYKEEGNATLLDLPLYFQTPVIT